MFKISLGKENGMVLGISKRVLELIEVRWNGKVVLIKLKQEDMTIGHISILRIKSIEAMKKT